MFLEFPRVSAFCKSLELNGAELPGLLQSLHG